MFGSYLHRMILWELVKVSAMSLVALTGLLLMAGILAEATQHGLSFAQVLMVIPLIIPSTLPYTIPATTLFATSLVYGRLSADNEITAIKAAGINVLYVVWPSLFLGLVMSLATLGLYYHFIPYSHQILRSMFLKDVEELLYSMLRHEQKINHPKLPYAIWVENVQGKRLVNPYFKRRDVNGRYDLVAHAREAELRVDANNKKLLMHMKRGEVYSAGNETRAYFEDRVFDLPMSSMDNITERQRRPRELTWQEILERRVVVAEDMADLDAQIAIVTAQLLLVKSPRDIPAHLDNLKTKRFYVYREALALDTELQMRPALAMGCLCFVLVGCPVGIWFSRSDYLSAFMTCFLPIVMLYYPLVLCGTNMAKEGRFNAAVTTWAADVAMTLISLVLFRRLFRH